MDCLKQSVLTAFYTPSAVTEALADVLKEHQIIPKKVLESSAGIGAFVDSVLDNNPKADIMAFEKDLLTGKILRHLHPEQKVRIEGFEKIEKPFNDYFDLAISNIPFGDVAVFDPSYTAMKGMRALVTRRIHNYFFVKALDTVRDGGLVAFITSQGVLNAKNNSAARFMMLYHADLVSAIRLPNNHAGGLIACTVVSVLQSLVVFLLYLVPGKIVDKLHPAVGLAQTRERLLKLKQLVTVVLGVVFHVDSC